MNQSQVKKVLIVDDESMLRVLFSQLLKKTYGDDVEIYEAHNGTKALEMIDMIDFDLITLDYNMPEMNGRDVMMSLQQKGKLLNVIMITGYISEELVSIHYLLKTVLLKPVEIDILLKNFKLVLGEPNVT